MAVQFKPLKLENTELFGVRMSGSMSRGDRDRLKELADKCLENGRVNLVLDMSELGSMGGGGARMIAELQERLTAAEGRTLITGAGHTVKRFLDQKLAGKPVKYYASVEDAILEFGGGTLPAAEPGEEQVPGAEAPEPAEGKRDDDEDGGRKDRAAAADQDEEPAAVGAVGFCDEEEIDGEMDDLLGEFTAAEASKGRRKDHHYTSLAEIMDMLGSWSDRASQMDFADALKNLLFSQGLAEDVLLLIAKGGLLVSADGYKEILLDGSLAAQAEQVARPMTMLDIRDDDLTDEELSLLEIINPDMILPVLRRGDLYLLLLIKKGGEEREYSVSENFAFELLQRILERVGEIKTPIDRMKELQSEAVGAGKAPAAASVAEGVGAEGAPPGQGMDDIFLKMSLDMPQADDPPHFWRLFSRHLQPVMDLQEMAFLVAGGNHPQIMLGGDNTLTGLDCSDERLQKYFRTMELPVQVKNLPATFAATRKELKASRVNWIVALNWRDEFLGTLLINGEIQGGDDFSPSLTEAFNLASRLLVRFEDQNEDADIFLDLIYRLMAQREKRFFGSDSFTRALVEQLHRLAREMGFPPDQKRDLIYGCLLRDIGLIDKDDALMGSPADMTPNQWKSYRDHPNEGATLLSDLKMSQTVLEVVKCHHERFNGEGFPAGLSGRDIPLAARVVTVVENFVAMTTGVGGLEPRTAEEAAQVLQENLGERYDPDIVSIFLSVVTEG